MSAKITIRDPKAVQIYLEQEALATTPEEKSQLQCWACYNFRSNPCPCQWGAKQVCDNPDFAILIR